KLHRCFVALGLLAMAMALSAIPAGIALAAAKSQAMEMAADADEVPCHHPCPHCAKPCPDVGSCLLHCFQPLASVFLPTGILAHAVRELVAPALSRRISEAPIPPLLRPPCV